MTVPAKYTLTEAHFIIVELEREVERLRWAGNAMSDQVDELTEQRVTFNHDLKEQKAISGNWEKLYEREKARVKELEEDLEDERNDCVQDQAYIVKLKAHIEELEETLARVSDHGHEWEQRARNAEIHLRAEARKHTAWRDTAARKGKLLLEAYPYVESALMASANQGFHVSAQTFLDRYRKEIGK